MEPSVFNHPGLTIALALAMGMIAQALAHHLRIPGIVLLLAAGVALGPDGVNLIRPESLGTALNILTGFAVAVILFEGGLNLEFRRLKRAQRSIRQLILLGGLLTVTGASAAVHFIMHWPWRNAVLFGVVVMVTGPTVINPLLKRLRVKRSVATVLEAEGVLIDALGAVLATVVLEAVLSPARGSLLVWGWHVVSRLGFGALCGVAVVPENVFTLAAVLALFQGSNAILSESGIAAVTMAGIIIGNFSTYVLRDLVEFKEELTVLLIGMLFVLLAADVRLEQVAGLGWPAVWVVLALMFLVRPVAVFAGTAFGDCGCGRGFLFCRRLYRGGAGGRLRIASPGFPCDCRDRRVRRSYRRLRGRLVGVAASQPVGLGHSRRQPAGARFGQVVQGRRPGGRFHRLQCGPLHGG